MVTLISGMNAALLFSLYKAAEATNFYNEPQKLALNWLCDFGLAKHDEAAKTAELTVHGYKVASALRANQQDGKARVIIDSKEYFLNLGF